MSCRCATRLELALFGDLVKLLEEFVELIFDLVVTLKKKRMISC